jgi:hypothetical protein
MKAPKAWSRSSEEPSARAQRFEAQPLGLGGARGGDLRLGTESPDEPARYEGHQHAHAELEGHVRDVVRAVVDVARDQVLEDGLDRRDRDGEGDGPDDAVANRRLDDHDQEQPPDRRALLEVEDEDERRDEHGVEGERRSPQRGLRARPQVAPREREDDDRAEREHPGGKPGVLGVAGRILLGEGDLGEREGHGEQAYEGDPALDVPHEQPAHGVRSSIRASAHSACSRSIGSGSSA